MSSDFDIEDELQFFAQPYLFERGIINVISAKRCLLSRRVCAASIGIFSCHSLKVWIIQTTHVSHCVTEDPSLPPLLSRCVLEVIFLFAQSELEATSKARKTGWLTICRVSSQFLY